MACLATLCRRRILANRQMRKEQMLLKDDADLTAFRRQQDSCACIHQHALGKANAATFGTKRAGN